MPSPRIRILVLDDDRDTVELVRTLLTDAVGEEPDLTWTSTHAEALRLLRDEDVDVCLADHRVAGCTVTEFLQEAVVECSGVPVILMSGQVTPETERAAQDAGAVDCLPKGEVSAPWFERAVRYAVERRRRQQAEARVRALLGAVREIVCVLDPDGQLRYVSPSLFRVLGFPAEAKTGESSLLEVHPDDRPDVERALGEVVADPTVRRELRYRVRHADGSWRILDTVAENHLDDPDVQGLVVTSRDVTERVRQEEHVRLQASLLEAVGQAVTATDLAGKVIYWNHVAEDLYGWSRDEVLGTHILDLNVTPERRADAQAILETVETEGSWTGEFQARRKDGSTVTILTSNSIIRDTSGDAMGLIGVSSDITPLKETEAALRERVKELSLLSGASEILNLADLSIEERLRKVVDLIPSGWLDSERTEARLTLKERTIQTDGFRETPWMLSAEVRSVDETGRLDVALTEEPPEAWGAPFLPEEHELLENLARIVGDAVGRASLQRLLTQAFASVQEAVLVVGSRDDGRRIQYVNPAAERMFGHARNELVGGTTEKLHMSPDSFRRFGEESAAALRREGVFHGDYPLRRKDGSTFEAEQTVTVLSSELGLDGGAVSVIRDVSERRVAERRLLESEERFRQIAEHIEDVFWIAAPGKVEAEYVSPAYAEIWGQSLTELYERPESWVEAIVPEDRKRVAEASGRQAEVPYEHEYRIRRPDGEERWILDRSFPVRGEDGRVERVIGVARDVTDAKRMEERVGALIQEITDVISVVSPEGEVRMASPSVHRVLGYTRSEFEGMNGLDVVHPEDRPAIHEKLLQVAGERGGTVRAEFRAITKAGKLRHVEVVTRNLLHDLAVNGILVTLRDVTERTELEGRVRQMQKMESIGQLAGGIAHDFNNLLTVIRSQADLVLMDLPTGADAEEVRVIQAAADRAATLTGQLLAFSREQVLQPRTVGLAGTVRDAGRLIQRLIGEDVRVVYELDEAIPPVRVDPHQLEQVILNLAVNARDAMPTGGTLTLSTGVDELSPEAAASLPDVDPGTYVTLSISDTGVGMSEDVLQRIFDPFFTTKSKGKGTGLGLAMVYGTVRQSGGSIHVESEPGRGATFTLRFPPVESDEGKGTPVPEERAAGTPEGPPLTGTVLVVEDDAAVRSVATRMLEKAGFQVFATEDAEAGLELLRKGWPVDAILSDLVLPGLSGDELIHHLRNTHPGLPLILMSGYAEGSPATRDGLPEGVTFLPKPFTPEGLLETVRTVLKG